MDNSEFKKILINATEAFIDHKMTPSGIEVLINYFNDEKCENSLERSVKAMERYAQKDLPSSSEMSKKVKEALNVLAYAAEKWDRA